MIFSGANYRKLQEKENYNFFLETSISNLTGVAEFGFSGAGEKFTFNFNEGRVIDPSDNYTFSYDTGSFVLSGVVNDTYYNYSINNELIVSSGIKNSFNADRFFVDCTGCNLDVTNLIVQGSGPSVLSLQNMNQFIGDSGHFTGQVVINDSSFGKFDIFSGEVTDPVLNGLFSILTDFSTGIDGTGNLGVSGIQNIENQTSYTFEAILYTSFGEVVQTFNVTGTTPFYQPNLTLTDLQSVVASGGFPSQTKELDYIGSNTLFTGSPLFATGLPINASLSYLQGFTGQITGALTGVNILTSGTNYSINSLPDIIVTGDGEGAIVSGLVSTNGSLTGINVFLGGSGYSTPPTILIYSGVSAIQVNNGGNGYFSSPAVQFDGGTQGGTPASATLNVSNGSVSSVAIINRGNRYTGVPTLTITPGLSGINLTSSGSGYLSEPSVFINNGGGSGAAVDALTGDPNSIHSGFITGFNLVSGGSGYTGVPTVLVSGGGAAVTGSGEAILSSGFQGTVIMSSGATANAFIGDYTKDFTGVFNLLTGSGGNFHNFLEAGQITSDNLSYTGESIFFKENLNLSIGVESEIDIEVQNFNYYDSLPLIAELTVSGSGSQIVSLQVTGIK